VPSGARTPINDLEKQSPDETALRNSEPTAETPPEAEDHSKNPWHPSQFPDGGLEAWLVVAGAACGMFCSFGWLNAIGVFQSYYQTHQLKEYTASESKSEYYFAMIIADFHSCMDTIVGGKHSPNTKLLSSASILTTSKIFMMFIMGPLVGYVYDNRGPRELLVVGSFLHVFGLMMTSISNTYYQIILAQGICSPLGLNCIFNASIGTVSTWFFKKRGAAFGIMVMSP
jgi:MFS family permease